MPDLDRRRPEEEGVAAAVVCFRPEDARQLAIAAAAVDLVMCGVGDSEQEKEEAAAVMCCGGTMSRRRRAA